MVKSGKGSDFFHVPVSALLQNLLEVEPGVNGPNTNRLLPGGLQERLGQDEPLPVAVDDGVLGEGLDGQGGVAGEGPGRGRPGKDAGRDVGRPWGRFAKRPYRSPKQAQRPIAHNPSGIREK